MEPVRLPPWNEEHGGGRYRHILLAGAKLGAAADDVVDFFFAVGVLRIHAARGEAVHTGAQVAGS